MLNSKKLLRIAIILLFVNIPVMSNSRAATYTVLPVDEVQAIQQQSATEITQLIKQLKPEQSQNDYLNTIVKTAYEKFSNRSYAVTGAQGESNWCPGNFKKRNCVHIQQDPIYHTDKFDCMTYVETVLGLINANNLDQYEKNFLMLAYGAAGLPASRIHFYNRNNFVSADFNPVNHKTGLLTDVTSTGPLKSYARWVGDIIDRNKWFAKRAAKNATVYYVRVLSAADGPAMVNRLQDNYPQKFHQFKPEKVRISYIPKQAFFSEFSPKNFTPNQKLLDLIPTPAVAEIVRDDDLWFVGGKNIREIVGTGNNVSHLGLLYREHFAKNQLIYQKITCASSWRGKSCNVEPVVCLKNEGCNELMFTHATDAYPHNFYYYPHHGKYVCTPKPPSGNTTPVNCNHVVSVPLTAYLASKQFNQYTVMGNPSILGIHVEKINDVENHLSFK